MPRRIFSFDEPDRFVCGAVGRPGQRTFFIQATKGEQVVSVALEKAQVALLAERLATLLLALREGGVAIGDELPGPSPAMSEPIVEQFRVGTLTLGWDGDAGRVVIEAREIGDGDEDDEDEGDEDDEDEGDEDEGAEDEGDEDDEEEGTAEAGAELPSLVAALDDPRDIVRVQLEPDAALAFASGALEVVRAGRPPCPQCGAPLEPTGHFCPRRNGYTN